MRIHNVAKLLSIRGIQQQNSTFCKAMYASTVTNVHELNGRNVETKTSVGDICITYAVDIWLCLIYTYCIYTHLQAEVPMV